MPRNRFTAFLTWSRNYIAQYGREQYRRSWHLVRDRSPHPAPRIGYISNCDDCNAAIITGGDTFLTSISRRLGVSCGSCAFCSNCCGCNFCSQGNHYTNNDFCDDCDNSSSCTECCRCSHNSERANIEFLRNKPFFHDSKLHQRKVNPTTRYIAAEIEVAEIANEGYPLSELVKRWRGSIVEDGSLPASGFEINTAPASGDKYVQQINAICDMIHKVGGTVNTKCGLHVHVDARDFNYYDLRRLARAYAAIEPALFKMVPNSRRNSRFAKRCGMEYLDAMRWGKFPYSQVKADILKSTYRLKKIDRQSGASLKKLKKSKYQDARYAALNIHSWFFRGTIECRLFNGTTNADKIVNWGVMWALILDYVVNNTDDTIDRDLPLTDAASFENLLTMIGGNSMVKDFATARYEQYSKEEDKPKKAKIKRISPTPGVYMQALPLSSRSIAPVAPAVEALGLMPSNSTHLRFSRTTVQETGNGMAISAEVYERLAEGVNRQMESAIARREPMFTNDPPDDD
jgi:hypothetical protein